MKLVAETERLNLKSEMEVRCEILGKDNQLMNEERNKMRQELRETVDKYEREGKQMMSECDKLKNELLISKRKEA